ncbi:MAG: fimbrial protein [Bacteriovoracaceae bacterium]|nr:fimbrial protein [Bacteriovoracaceae bacterium]
MKYLVMVALVASASTFARTTGNLLLQGEVAQKLSLSIDPQSNQNIDIENGETSLLVAKVEETSNELAGYKIKISSLNGGELQNADDATKKTSYQVSYDGGQLVTPPKSGSAEVKDSGVLGGLVSYTSDVNIDVAALPNAAAGVYSDTVTFTIEAN